jgi:hypothetical protein
LIFCPFHNPFVLFTYVTVSLQKPFTFTVTKSLVLAVLETPKRA